MQPTIGRSKIRRFGTVLSVNSPGVTPSVLKKAKPLRNNFGVSKTSILEEETNQSSPQQKKKQFTVTFDAGPIGLQIDPATCRVQCILGEDSPARTLGMIQEGDAVVAVNGMPLKNDAMTDNEPLWDILQNVKSRRSITFERFETEATIVPAKGPENRSPPESLMVSNVSPLPPPRSISFLIDESAEEIKAHVPVVPPSGTATSLSTTEELALTRRELLGATNLLQQMQAKLDALEAENAALKQTPPPQQYHAIRDMEYKMRIHSLEDQLKQSNESRSKLKEQLRTMDQRLQDQSEHHRVALDHSSQEQSRAQAHSKETMHLLENTRKELATAKKEWQDEVTVLHRERDQLLERVEQHAGELERSRATKVQSDVRLQQLEENRTLLEEELQRTRAKVEESDVHAQQNNEQLLHTIRTKDVQIETLRMELVALQTSNATLQTDLSEKDALVRQVKADAELRQKEQESLNQDLMNLSSLLEMSKKEEERLESQISKLEDKLLDRNQALDHMKGNLKQVQDGFAAQLMGKSEALAASADAIDELYREKESLTGQLIEAQTIVQNLTRSDQELREMLAIAQLELSNHLKTNSSEKCDLLKRMEELEGELKVSRATILRQDEALNDETLQLRTAHEKLERMSMDLKENQKLLLLSEKKCSEQEKKISELNEKIVSKEKIYTTTITDLKRQLEESKQLNDALNQRNHAICRRMDILFKSLMSACITEVAARAALKESRSECSFLKNENNRLLTNIDELEVSVSSRDSTINSLHIDLSSSHSVYDRSLSEIRRLSSSLAKSESLYEESLIEKAKTEAQHQSVTDLMYSENKRLYGELALQSEAANVLNRKIEESTKAAISFSNQIEELSIVKQANEKLISELREEIVVLSKNYEEHKSSSKAEKLDFESQIVAYQERVDSLQAQLLMSEKSCVNTSCELDAAKSRVQDLETTIQSLECLLRETKDQIEERNAMIESLNQRALDLLQDFQGEISTKNEYIDDYRHQLDEKDAALAQIGHHADILGQDLSEARSELIGKLEVVESLEANLEDFQCQLKSSLFAQQEANLLIKSLNETIDANQRLLAVKAEEFELLTQSYDNLTLDNDSLKRQLSDVNAELSVVTAQFHASVEATNASKTQIEDLQRNALLLQYQFETEVVDKNGIISKLTGEIDSHLKELHDTQDQMHRVAFSESNLRSEVKQLKFQLANSEADFQKCNEILDRQTHEFDVTKQSLIEQKSRCDKLLHELMQSESSLDSFSRLIDSQNAQIATLKQSLLAQKADFDRDLQQSRMELHDYMVTNKSLIDKNVKLSESISNFEMSFAKADEVSACLKLKIGEMESEHSLTVARANKNEQDLLKRIESLRQNVTNIQLSLDERDNAITEFKQTLSLQDSKILRLSDQLSSSIVEKEKLRRSSLLFELMLEVAKRNEYDMAMQSDKAWTAKIESVSHHYESLLSEARSNVVVISAEFDNLNSDYSKQVDEIQSLHAALNVVTSEKEAFGKKISLIEAELRQSVKDLSDAVSRAENANNLALEKAGCLEDVERSLENSRNKALEQEERYANLLRDSSETRNCLVSDIIVLKEEIESLKNELDESSVLIKSLRMNQADSELLLQRVKDELNLEKEALSDVTAKSAASTWSLECEVEAAKAEINSYRDSTLRLSSECSTLRTELTSLQAKFDDVREKHTKSLSTIDSMENTMSSQQDDFAEQLESAKTTASMLSDELRSLKLEYESFVFDADTEKRQLEESIRILQTEAKLRTERQVEWTKMLEAERINHHRCRTDLDIASDKITHLEGLVRIRTDEVERLSLQLEKTIEENVATIESTAKLHSSKILQLHDENKDYDIKMKNANASIESLTVRLQALETDLSSVLSERDDLLSERSSLLLSLEERNNALMDLKEKLDNLNNLSMKAEPVESPFKSMSKIEIKDKCLELQHQLQTSQYNLTISNEDLYRRSEHIRQLSQDLDTMGAEIGRLVSANEMLETRLKELISLNDSLESASVVSKNKIALLETQLHNKSKKLDQISAVQCKLIDEIQTLKLQAKSEKIAIETEKNNAISNLSTAHQELEYAVARRDKAELLLSETRIELNLLRESELESKSQMEKLHLDISELTSKLAASTELTNTMKLDFEKKVDNAMQQVSSLESDCVALRSKISLLQLDVEEKDIVLKDKEEKERLLADDLFNQRQLTIAADQFREDVVSKLSEATRVITSQRFMIKKLESRAVDAEQNASHLSDRIESLQVSSDKRESAADDSNTRYFKLHQELENKLKLVDEARMVAVQSFEGSCDELLKVRLQLSDYEKVNMTLRQHIDELKNNLEVAKTHLSQARFSEDKSLKANHQLQSELDNKQMEIDHLKANLQVSTATTARLKATALLQETESQKDLPLNETLQFPHLYGNNNQEALFLRFIDELYNDSDRMLAAISFQTDQLVQYLYRYDSLHELAALDLAGLDKGKYSFSSFCSNVENLLVQLASYREKRRVQINSINNQRSDQHVSSTLLLCPPSESESTEDMNQFDGDILDLSKNQPFRSEHLDVEFFKSVILALEANIDDLLADLKAANEALYEKDHLLARLESLVAFYESLDSREQRDTGGTELRSPLKENVPQPSKGSSDESALSERSISFSADSHKNPSACKLAAGRLLLQALDGRTHAAKAIAFRQWACQTSAMSALAKHGSTAAALAQQLEETREKLVLLKRHLKKSRRCGGTRDFSTNLDRIEEHESEV